MTSPVSIGDAILLSKIAYHLARTFTSGRKSAPAEFQEVQNQLYALGGALGFLANDRTEAMDKVRVGGEKSREGDCDQDGILDQMISNCRMTLTHLEEIVDKYMVIDPSTADQGPTSLKSWRLDVKRNWKKIRWTTEGGDLDKLRSNLAVHINGLNLAFSAMHSIQMRNVENKANEVHSMLEDIYKWYIESIKRAPASPLPTDPQISSRLALDVNLEMTFEVYAEVPSGSEMGLICPKASFRHDWLLNRNRGSSPTMFKCHCIPRDGFWHMNNQRSEGEHAAHLQFCLLPVSLVTRLAGPQNLWQLYVSSRTSNGWVSLILGGLAPTSLNKFRESIDVLSIEQAKQQARGSSSMLMHASTDENFRILDTKRDVREFNGQISKLTFVAFGHRYIQESIDSVELLLYRCLSLSVIYNTEGISESKSAPQRHAELILRPLPSSSEFLTSQDLTQFVVDVEHDTKATTESGSCLITLSSVRCTAENESAKPDQIPSADVDIQFSTDNAAQKFLTSLKAMQQELFITYARFHRADEKVIFQIPAGDLMVHDFYLPDARLSVVLDPSRTEYRLIVLSSCTSMCVCMKLPPPLLESLARNIAGGVSREYPAYFVKVGWDTTTVDEQLTSAASLLLANDADNMYQSIRALMP